MFNRTEDNLWISCGQSEEVDFTAQIMSATIKMTMAAPFQNSQSTRGFYHGSSFYGASSSSCRTKAKFPPKILH